ncbi:FUSC family protein [Cellulomonas sp. zg-ZUI188]|uniref:FUSC family protein n=1 Tax=Cellulomonas fengjieae TaxID=2819978 RepID=A0ABS3SBN8_9CELL|nr:FUSC family protein [Cellulomonas fengjieae]MBO3102093.1 FUSC family protein [Cellulomonas fengjieae]QVI68011.1 FUSC family protein [Cellulomonas fengjieae]
MVRRDVRLRLAARVRQGWTRVQAAWFPILQASVAGALSFAIGFYVLGHAYPFFAPVSAWIALGFTADRSVRRVAELAVGVAIGVALGDLVVHVIGTGVWQVAVVLFAAAIIARFIDRGAMLTTQAGVQALVIVGLPAMTATGGPVGRWTDAVVGGVVALAITLLTPSDPRRHPRTLARTAVEDLAGVLRILGRGLAEGSTADVEDALVRGRASQPAIDDWSETAKNAGDLARVSPTNRRYREELAALAGNAVLADRAMRNARVLARRCRSVVAAQSHDLTPIAEQVEATAEATDDLAAALGVGRDPERARAQLLAIAAALDPFRLAAQDWQVQSLVLLARSLVVDLLEASGVAPQEAREALPEI